MQAMASNDTSGHIVRAHARRQQALVRLAPARTSHARVDQRVKRVHAPAPPGPRACGQQAPVRGALARTARWEGMTDSQCVRSSANGLLLLGIASGCACQRARGISTLCFQAHLEYLQVAASSISAQRQPL